MCYVLDSLKYLPLYAYLPNGTPLIVCLEYPNIVGKSGTDVKCTARMQRPMA